LASRISDRKIPRLFSSLHLLLPKRRERERWWRGAHDCENLGFCLPACLLLEIRWQKGRRAAAPSNFLSLPSTQFVKNKQIPYVGSTYTGEKRRGGPWAKHTGLKRGAIGNTLGKHIGNI